MLERSYGASSLGLEDDTTHPVLLMEALLGLLGGPFAKAYTSSSLGPAELLSPASGTGRNPLKVRLPGGSTLLPFPTTHIIMRSCELESIRNYIHPISDQITVQFYFLSPQALHH